MLWRSRLNILIKAHFSGDKLYETIMSIIVPGIIMRTAIYNDKKRCLDSSNPGDWVKNIRCSSKPCFHVSRVVAWLNSLQN